MITGNNSPNQLPKNWVQTRLREVCLDPQYGWTTSAVVNGTTKLLRTTDITSGQVHWETVPFCKKAPDDKKKYILKDGDIVISRAGSVGYSYLLKKPERAVFASYLIRFRPLIDKHYLAYFLQSPFYWRAISEKKLGIAVPNVNASKLKEIEIPLPPLPEQKRIVAKIEELFTKLDAGVEALKKIKAQLKRYRQAVLKHAFEGKLTEKWRNAHKGQLEPASKLLERIAKERERKAKGRTKKLPPLDTSELPELPKEWGWATMPQVGELNRGKSRHRPRNAPYLYGGQYPFVQTGDVRKANGIIKKYTQTYNEEGLKQSRLWPKGSLCITIAANIADTAFLGFDACIPDSVVGFRTSEGHCDIKFVEFFLRTAKANLERYAPATAQKNINLAILSVVAIPFPPLLEQNKIVSEIERHLSIANQIEQTIEQGLKQSERLRQSILKRAFEGKLVPQDPEDEPAEKLLERIKAEKAKLQIQQKRKKAMKASKNIKA